MKKLKLELKLLMGTRSSGISSQEIPIQKNSFKRDPDVFAQNRADQIEVAQALKNKHNEGLTAEQVRERLKLERENNRQKIRPNA